MSIRWLAIAVCVVALAGDIAGQARQAPRPQQPARDSAARPPDTAPVPTGRLPGRVVAGDSGRPVKRARVFINAAELPGGRGMLTDDSGVFDFTELPAGRYTVTVSKSGFVSLSYGQRRPLQAGIPLQLGDGQQLKNVDFQLPRGSVIGGRVMDEDGEPMAGVMVRVMRYQYLQGDRRLTPAGTAQTDDRGAYRIWGLMPGDYYINAVARVNLPGPPPGGRGGPGRGAPGGRGAAFGGGAGPAGAVAAIAAIAGGNVAQLFDGSEPDTINYAPTYYPGVASLSDAKPIALGLSQEMLDINFGMQLVPMSRVAGRVTNPDGSPVTAGNVNLLLDGAATSGNRIGANFGGRISWDGAFTINNVPPGRYILRARATDSETPQYASIPVSVSGAGSIPDLNVVLTPGATLSGVAMFPSAATAPPEITQFRVTAPSIEPGFSGPQPNARLDKDGRFVLTGVPAGAHLIRSAGGGRGWSLKSVTQGGRDITDTPIELRSGETVSNLTLVFTDKVQEISGTVTDTQGLPASEYTILAFSTDAALWRPQSRQIATTRPDQTGQYRLRTLPPGEYYVVTVDPAEQGEWFEPAYLEDHRSGAARVTLSEGDVKTQNFTIRK
jgi:hypothetical protein